MPAGIIAVHYSLFVVVCACIAAACLLLARLKVRPRHIAILASSAIAGRSEEHTSELQSQR